MKRIVFILITILALMLCVSCSCDKNSENGGGSVNNSPISTPHEHAWDKGKITVAATEEAPGKMSYTCLICNLVREESIPKTPHRHFYTGVWERDRMNHWHKCLMGNCTVKGEKGAHEFDEGEIIKEANQSTSGVKKFTCAVCLYTKEEEYRARAEVTGEEFASALNSGSFENVTVCLSFEGKTTIIKYANGKREIDGEIIELNFDKLEYESFTYNEDTRAYFYDTGSRKYSCQFADGRLCAFSVNTDGDIIKMEFSNYGKTVIE